MSNDLINRGKAIENFHKIPKIWNGNECLVSFQTVIDYMNSQRIAYDEGKVIEKLKKNEEDAIKSIMEYGKTEFHLIKITDLKELFETYTKEQIEIVKSGGVSDD